MLFENDFLGKSKTTLSKDNYFSSYHYNLTSVHIVFHTCVDILVMLQIILFEHIDNNTSSLIIS